MANVKTNTLPVRLGGPLHFTLASSPAALSGDVNNYALSDETVLRIDGGLADRTLTGIDGGAEGRVLYLLNVGTTNKLTLSHQSGSSLAANRVVGGGASDVVVRHGAGAMLMYDATASRWRVISEPDIDADGPGDVVGPASSADNNVPRYDTTTGKLIQASNLAIGDTGVATMTTGANGSTMVDGFLTEIHTLAAAATSDTVIGIPAGAVVSHVALRVTTLITGATSFDLGIAGTTSRYGDDLAVTAGTVSVTADPRAYAAPTLLRFTANGGDFTAGVVRVDIHYKLATAPTS